MSTKAELDIVTKRTGDDLPQLDIPDTPLRFSEKKRLEWSGKTCKCMSSRAANHRSLTREDLAPLTTVGNLVSFFFCHEFSGIHSTHSPFVDFVLNMVPTSLVARVGLIFI
jgi:hypothetical protein